MPLSCILKMVKIVTMLCVFYHNKKLVEKYDYKRIWICRGNKYLRVLLDKIPLPEAHRNQYYVTGFEERKELHF